MNRDARILCTVVFMFAGLAGCSSTPPGGEAKKAAVPMDKIQGKVQVLPDTASSGDAALNPGGMATFLWQGKQRYRLFFRRTTEVVNGNEYVVEGINGQKAIDDIGDPDQGKNGYPLRASCDRVVKMAWTNMPFDEIDVKSAILRARVARYPARPIFLVARMEPVGGEAKKEEDKDADLPTISVPADKQKALLLEGTPVQTAPLWEPAGSTMKCKVIIDTEGKISELETGAQLCEAVQWSKFKYKPTLQGGKPVRVRTEVEVTFEARK